MKGKFKMRQGKNITREDYKRKFDKLMETFNFIPQAGEEIVQCREPYPAYWFVSNKGYVLSVSGNGIKYIAPAIKKTGVKNKNGERSGRDWYVNSSAINGKKTSVSIHKIVADHFCINEFSGDYEGDTHHIIKKNSFADNQWKECNEAANLQKLPTEIHQELTQYSKKQPEQIEAEWDQQIKEDHAEVINMTNDQMIALINTLIQQGVDCRVYLIRDSDQAAAAYPVVGIATHRDAEGNTTNRFVPKKIKKDPK